MEIIMQLCIAIFVVAVFFAIIKDYPRTTSETPTHSEYYEIYVAYDIFYIEKHPDYQDWYSIHSEKFGELVQGCDGTTAFRFLHDNSYREVNDKYNYNYQSIE